MRQPLEPGQPRPDSKSRLWIERLQLTNFRNYGHAALSLGPEPVLLTGANGAGKTNLLEAVSLLAAGQGLRRAPYVELARKPGDGDWAVAATLRKGDQSHSIGTGLAPGGGRGGQGRIVRIEGATQRGSGVLADHIEMVWVTPATDGIFTGPAADRRRFLDRLILCFDALHRSRTARYERAMQSRNRLLADGVREPAQLAGLEGIMAEAGVAIAAARVEAIAALQAVIADRRDRHVAAAFPWSTLALAGPLERDVSEHAAVDVEDRYVETLREARDRDRAAGRCLDGPHRSDFEVAHGPKATAARHCSTGEQKALLMGLVLAHAALVSQRHCGRAPILLLDEVAAHLDAIRRAALFAEIVHLGGQAWMTGTDLAAFEAIVPAAQIWTVDDGRVTRLSGSAHPVPSRNLRD